MQQSHGLFAIAKLVVTFVTHVTNLRKFVQKLWSLSWTKGLCGHTDRHTDRHTLKWFYICPMPWIALDRQWCVLQWRPTRSERSVSHPFHGWRNVQCSISPSSRHSATVEYLHLLLSHHDYGHPKAHTLILCRLRIWGVLQKRVNRIRINSVDSLK